MLNRLLPFTRPGTPLIQDILHSVVLASIIYFAPRILEKQLERDTRREAIPPQDKETVLENEVTGAEQRLEGSDAEAEGHQDLEGHEDIQYYPTDSDTADNAIDHANPPPQAHPQQPTDTADTATTDATAPRTRTIGKKKAKSLARKDQTRAYHEFQRQQGEAQRARDREIEASLAASLAEEKHRRALLEQDLQEKRRQERQSKRDQDRSRREQDAERKARAISLVHQGLRSHGYVRISELVKTVGGGGDDGIDSTWVERLVRAEGMLGLQTSGSSESTDALTMLTSTGYIVLVTNTDLQEAYQRALNLPSGSDDGKVSYEAVGRVLEEGLLERGTGKGGGIIRV
ncbi:hypothetical protein FGG08_002422 [Glutinoglossum americanum]|uniref:Uncharacterized protein n=1 Tax=Glutinoglossum americanum TaxID=1670608 RepID=A0A9P8L1Q3_9PEZI|nr:hypothetical protein FGG08_002422 [Glutinoglossum americanum]